jgi:hypothetical protein
LQDRFLGVLAKELDAFLQCFPSNDTIQLCLLFPIEPSDDLAFDEFCVPFVQPEMRLLTKAKGKGRSVLRAINLLCGSLPNLSLSPDFPSSYDRFRESLYVHRIYHLDTKERQCE